MRPASDAASSASISASSAQAHYNQTNLLYQSFRGMYYGPLASDPSSDPNGQPVNSGDWYFNTTLREARIFTGLSWESVSPASAKLTTFVFVAESGQTTFTGEDSNGNPLTYTPNFVKVFRNGQRLVEGTHYTANDGSTVTLSTPASLSDVILIDAYTPLKGATDASRIGFAELVPTTLPDDGILLKTGRMYRKSAYPDLAALMPGLEDLVEGATETGLIEGTPDLPSPDEAIAFSPDGSLLAVSLLDNPRLVVIDTETWTVLEDTPSLTNSVYALAFSPDSSLLAVGVAFTLKVYNTSDWQEVASFSWPGICPDIKFSQDGSLLAAANGGISGYKIIDTDTWEIVDDLPSEIENASWAAFSPEGSLLAVITNTGELAIFNTSTWEEIEDAPEVNNALRLAFSPDGSLLAVGRSSLHPGGSLAVFDTSTWDQVWSSFSVGPQFHRIKFSPDGTMLVAVIIQGDGLVALDTSRWALLEGFPQLSFPAGSDFAFSPDSRLLAIVDHGSPYLRVYVTPDTFVVPEIEPPNEHYEYRIRAR